MTAASALLLALPMCVRDDSSIESKDARTSDEAAARAALAGAPLGHVVSRDAQGKARVIAGGAEGQRAKLAMKSETVARAHLSRHAGLLGLDEATARDVTAGTTHSLAGGASVVQFEQQIEGVPVFHARANVVLDADNHLVTIASNLAPDASAAPAFSTTAESALARAYEAQFAVALPKDAARAVGDGRHYTMVTPEGAPRVLEASVSRVLFPEPFGLAPAYHVEFLARAHGSKEDQAYGYVMADRKGRVLYRASLTHSESFRYRVWAEANGNHVPTDGPLADYSPHPTGSPDPTEPGFRDPNLITMEGFNRNPQGKADPWLSADATVTSGNNVHAYSDRDDTHTRSEAGVPVGDGFNPGVDIEADTTEPRTFDRTYDVGKQPNASTEQIKASVTQLFYVTNWLHDYWYDSGFDEKSGVAQRSNFGRGGKEGDPMRVEAQDGADHQFTNNANMSTPEDGTSPRMQMYVFTGEPVSRDGTLDNTIVAHEWGHYLHLRLVRCSPAPADPEFPRYSVGSCTGMSEGWADFTALFMVLREGDRMRDSAYPLSQYAGKNFNPNASYFGIRRAPYSTDMTKNPFTFGHVRKASALPTTAPINPVAKPHEVHNVGEIWAQMLFEGYVNLHETGQAATPPRTFQETQRRMADYLVAGMKITPAEPTFVQQRDAILSAVLATGRKDDFQAIAKGFAKRGLGIGAIAPSGSSSTLNEAVESFDTGGDLELAEAALDDSVASCDRDGVLDAGETGQLTLRVRNSGWAALAGTKVSVKTTDPNVTLGNGGEATLESLDMFGTATVTIPITAKNTAVTKALLPIQISLGNEAAHTKSATSTFQTLYNSDDVTGSAATDNVESASVAWAFGHGASQLDGWSRQGDPANHIWHGNAAARTGDESLVSPNLVVGPSDFTISFRHHFRFEAGPAERGGPLLYWDGGVLEISDDGGKTWKDVSTYTDPGYTQTIYPLLDSENPLKGRKAWAGDSVGYPNDTNASINLGKALAGKTVKVRFRIGTDQGTGAAGWDIDDIAFGGITNLPFAVLVDDRAKCEADAGAPGTKGVDAGTEATSASAGSGGGGGCSVSSTSRAGAGGRSSWRLGSGFGIGAFLLLLLGRRLARPSGTE